MPLPKEAVTLSAEEISQLNKELTILRHEVNNNLALIIAAAEIIRLHPERAKNYWDGLTARPHKIAESVSQFSTGLEKALRIRPR